MSLALIAVLTTVGCGSTTESTPMSGTWHATRFEVTPDRGQVIDALAYGATGTLVLSPDGRAEATGFIPARVISDGPITETRVGTYSAIGGVVRFSYHNEPAVQAIAWHVGTNTLSVEGVHAQGGTFNVTLTRE